MPGAVYFARTRHTLSGTFLAYWRCHGGVDTFGYPRAKPFVEDGRTIQYMDRFALALVNGVVQTLPVNDSLVQRQAFSRVSRPTQGAGTGIRFFADTGHSLARRVPALLKDHYSTRAIVHL